ncbi:hypothetical protein [Xylocopilactobacillus apis]|uniref:Uncharacterized protein n=1 Tax=Xylocopilactobacillus apis TaxID=2932183 RepID=A0AAU9D456_9LACO|nr:hypothetical protein [Xylocopilactobacillus apis]BDR55622.1 hypothetical protein KIMC2_01840 [Xylocopilactobacillus apis]
MIKKIIKLSQKTDNVKYGIIAAYLLYMIPVCVSMSLAHAGSIYNGVFQVINFITMFAFWLFAVVLGRLSGVSQGYSGYFVILSVWVYQKFSFLTGHQVLFITLFVIGTFWLIYELLRAFLYSSTLARIDPKALTYNISGNLLFFLVSYFMSLAPSASLTYQTGNGAESLLIFIYYFLHVLGIAAVGFSIWFYLYNLRKRANRSTIWGNSFLIVSSVLFTFLFFLFTNLVWSALFYYVVALMPLGCVLIIPININKDSLKNHDLAI